MANVSEIIQISKQTVSGYFETVKKKKELQKRKKEIAPMASRIPGSTLGPIALIFGSTLLAVILALIFVNVLFYDNSLGLALGIGIVPIALSLFLIIWGYRKNTQAKFYEEYRIFFDKKPFAKITTLAKRTGASVSATTKRLRYFKEAGYYPKAFFTENDHYFVLSKGAEQMLGEELEKQEEVRKRQEQEETLKNDYPVFSEVSENIDQSIALIKNTPKTGKKKMDKDLEEIEESLDHIKNYLRKNPEQIRTARSFLNYFLPTTDRLLKTYSELENEVQTPNVKEARKDIETVLSSLNAAYKHMYDDFYTQTALDVYSDVTVLETMIKQNFPEEDKL